MSHDPFLPLTPYVAPPPSVRAESTSSPDSSIDSLVSNRRKILEVKFELFSGLVRRRLDIRQINLDSLLEDELKIHNLKNASPGYFIPAAHQEHLEERLLKISRERREEEKACWNDLVPVIRDLVLTWEALEQGKARGAFLKSATDFGQYGGLKKNE